MTTSSAVERPASRIAQPHAHCQACARVRAGGELGFAPERTAKILAKEGAHLKKQPAFKRHLG